MLGRLAAHDNLRLEAERTGRNVNAVHSRELPSSGVLRRDRAHDSVLGL